MGWLGYAALSAVLAGLVAIFGKMGVRGIDNTVATTVRAASMRSPRAARTLGSMKR